MSLIANLFGHSPIRPMQEHMRAAVQCARQIVPLFEEMIAGDTAAVTARHEEIDRLEHEADRIKNEIRSHLPKRMFLAVERRDMLEILDYQDSIADVAQDIAELADMRSMVIPKELASAFLELVRCGVSACEQAERVINELDELLETGFRGREAVRVDMMIEDLCRMESETDELEERVQRLLFGMESELGISVIFWYKLVDYAGDMADYAERVGNRLRLLTAN
jgi:predicted phosphate transport protein (TIGR00153 family)